MAIAKIETKPEIYSYLSELNNLLAFSSESIHNSDNPELNDFIKLLKFKTDQGLKNSFDIDLNSGMPTFVELCRIVSEKENLSIKKSGIYTLQELKDNLIKHIDDAKDIQSDFFYTTIQRIAERYYLDLLSESKLESKMHIDISLLEEDYQSNLMLFKVSGYSLSLATFCRYDIEMHVKKDKFFPMIKYEDKWGISKRMQDTIFRLFGEESNLAFHIIQKNKKLFPRKVKRFVYGPYYQKYLNPETFASSIDPDAVHIHDKIKGHENGYVLCLHVDETTTDLSNISKNSGMQGSILSIENYYITESESAADTISSLIPKDRVILKKR